MFAVADAVEASYRLGGLCGVLSRPNPGRAIDGDTCSLSSKDHPFIAKN